MNTRSILIAIFTLTVIGVFGFGFYVVGSPEHNRQLNVDKQKRADLWSIKQAIDGYTYKNCKLPQTLTEVDLKGYSQPKLDMSEYAYKLVDKNNYELCSSFNLEYNYKTEQIDPDNIASTPVYNSPSPYEGDFYEHKAGYFCFKRPLFEDNNYNKEHCTKKK